MTDRLVLHRLPTSRIPPTFRPTQHHFRKYYSVNVEVFNEALLKTQVAMIDLQP
jgi:hypothetical protein